MARMEGPTFDSDGVYIMQLSADRVPPVPPVLSFTDMLLVHPTINRSPEWLNHDDPKLVAGVDLAGFGVAGTSPVY